MIVRSSRERRNDMLKPEIKIRARQMYDAASLPLICLVVRDKGMLCNHHLYVNYN